MESQTNGCPNGALTSFDKYFISPDAPSKCKWAAAQKSKSPSVHRQQSYPRPKPKILPNILSQIGDTPMVRLNRIGKDDGLECEILAKCEYFNAGGSVKDRIGLRMIEEAEVAGHLKPGMTIIEPTSGNTGIGLALAAAVKGYGCIIVMCDRMSKEKEDVLRGLGAKIVRTPTGARFDTPESPNGLAYVLHQKIPNSIVLDQYRNAGNPLAHYDQTAEEILNQCDGKIDMIVLGAGTGGTITGISRKFKEKCPSCKIVGVDPMGSVILEKKGEQESPTPEDLGCTELEGVGYDFVPTVLDRSLVDVWVKAQDKEAFETARRLIKEEGMLCGGSSGAIVWGALQAAKSLKPGQRCVVILPDGVRNYMTKFLSDDWMLDHDFIELDSLPASKEWWWNVPVQQLNSEPPLIIAPSASVHFAADIMRKESLDQLPVMDKDRVVGVVTQSGIVSKLIANKIQPQTPVGEIICKQFKTVHPDTTLGALSRILEANSYALVVPRDLDGNPSGSVQSNNDLILGLITRIDFINFVASASKNPAAVNGF